MLRRHVVVAVGALTDAEQVSALTADEEIAAVVAAMMVVELRQP